MSRISSRGVTDPVSFDRVADTFERTRPIPLDVLTRTYRRLLHNLRHERQIVILDVGVGTGRMIRPLLNRRVSLIGVDISLAMLSRLKLRYSAARRKMELHIIRADASNLPLRDSSVRIVQSTHILHLLRSWRKALVEWQRVTANGGVLVLMWESGQRSPIRRVYERASREPLTYRGMRSSRMRRFLNRRGWGMRKWQIRWRQSTPIPSVLSTLASRSYSRQRPLSDRAHARGMVAARECAAREEAKGKRRESLRRALEIMVFSETT